LILANRRLVFSIVGHYKIPGIALDDLIQEGNVGLIRAAQNFDPSTHGIRFSSYAAFWVRAFVQRAISNEGSLVRLPEYTRLLRERCLRALRELEMQGHVQPEPAGEESPGSAPTALYPGLSHHSIDLVQKGSGEPALCSAPDGQLTQFQTPEDDLLEQEERAAVHTALRRLNPFEAWVIRERFGLREWCSEAIDSITLKEKPAEQTTAPRARRRRRSRKARAARGSATYYSRTHENLGHDCGLSVHRLRLVERAALDKLRSILSPPVARCLSPQSQA
jgi:RNA polymerase sigma factor (sigma-70 family)